MITKYISAEGRASLLEYKYAGQDKSYLYRFFHSPWAEFCVQNFVPWTTAPNTITFIGLMLNVLSLLVAFYYNPHLDESEESNTPAWSVLLTVLCMFCYTTLDNMDGKQARRTGASSPLGLLFDHGCDAINAGLVSWAAVALHCKPVAGSWENAALWLIPTIPFFYNTWEEYHIGELVLPVLNGPNEGLLMTMLLLVYTANARPGNPWMDIVTHKYAVWISALVYPVIDFFRYWVERDHDLDTMTNLASTYMHVGTYTSHANHYYSIMKDALQSTPDVSNMRLPTKMELMIATTFISVFVTISGQVYTVIRYLRRSNKSWWDVVSALSQQLNYVYLAMVILFWHKVPVCQTVLAEYWYIFYGIAGLLFADMTCKIMLAHTTDQSYNIGSLSYRTTLFGLAPLTILLATSASTVPYLQNLVAHLPASLANVVNSCLFTPQGIYSFAVTLLLASFIIAASGFISFVHYAVGEICEALDINVFDISKQLARAQQQQQGQQSPKEQETTPEVSLSKPSLNGPSAVASSPATKTRSSSRRVTPVRARRGSVAKPSDEVEGESHKSPRTPRTPRTTPRGTPVHAEVDPINIISGSRTRRSATPVRSTPTKATPVRATPPSTRGRTGSVTRSAQKATPGSVATSVRRTIVAEKSTTADSELPVMNLATALAPKTRSTRRKSKTKDKAKAEDSTKDSNWIDAIGKLGSKAEGEDVSRGRSKSRSDKKERKSRKSKSSKRSSTSSRTSSGRRRKARAGSLPPQE